MLRTGLITTYLISRLLVRCEENPSVPRESEFIRGTVPVGEFGFGGKRVRCEMFAPDLRAPYLGHPTALAYSEFELERNLFASLVSGEPRRPVISSIFML